jgi:putative transposase
VARYNLTARYDRLAQHLFETIAAVQARASNWLWTYNNQRLNIAIGGITPKQRLAMAA